MTEAARAARRAARSEPLVLSLGNETFTLQPEFPLDVTLAAGELNYVTTAEMRVWAFAHLLLDAPCDGECVEEKEQTWLRDRACPAEKTLRSRLRKVRIDGRKVSEVEWQDFYERMMAAYRVDEGESQSSSGSSATDGDS